jgi:hypothetical protein
MRIEKVRPGLAQVNGFLKDESRVINTYGIRHPRPAVAGRAGRRAVASGTGCESWRRQRPRPEARLAARASECGGSAFIDGDGGDPVLPSSDGAERKRARPGGSVRGTDGRGGCR